jgi:predicted RNase H-like HicB family nuclease
LLIGWNAVDEISHKGAALIKYELIICWREDDQAFIAEVPELPGCMADGETYELTVANVKTVIEQWIETARELGRTIPEPKGRLMFA